MLKKAIAFLLITLPIFASPISISVINPTHDKVPITVESNGIVIPKNKTSISARSSGFLQLQVSENSFVSKGQIIAKLRNEPREKKIELLKKSLAVQKNGIELQREKTATAEDKYKMGVGSETNFLSEKLVMGQLLEQYNTTQSQYSALQLEQINSIVRTPQNGVLINLAQDNLYINYGAQIGFLLETKNQIKLFVDSAYIKYITKGAKVKIFSSFKNCDAEVTNILPNSTNNLIEIIAKTDEKLPLNLQINAQITLQYFQGVKIPKRAIVLVNNHPAVYIIDDNNVAHVQYIDIIKDMSETALVSNVFPANTKIAFQNAYLLHDKLKVSVK